MSDDDLPDALRRWAAQQLGDVHDVRLLSASNSHVWRVTASDGRPFVLKHLRDASSMPHTEYVVRHRLRETSHNPSPRRAAPVADVHRVTSFPDGSAFIIADFIPGTSLDQTIAGAGYQAAEWARQLIGLMEAIAGIPVMGFGKLNDALTAPHTRWSAFLVDYLAEQRAKAPGLAEMRYQAVRELLDAVDHHLDRLVPEPGLVAADINNRNFMCDSTGLTCINLPVLWAGDPVASWGQGLLHWEGTAGERVLTDACPGPRWRMHWYAAYHAYVILAYVERFSPVPLEQAAPWGRRTPLLDLLDYHLAAAWTALARRTETSPDDLTGQHTH